MFRALRRTRPGRRHLGALVLGLLLAATALPVAADGPTRFSDWGAPQPVANDPSVPAEARVNTAAHDGCPIESPNGKQLFIASPRPGTAGKNDIWVASRPHRDAAWGPMVNLGAPVNSTDHDFCPTPLGGGLLLFVSDRAGGCGATPGMNPPVGDIYLTRQRSDGTWTTPLNLGCEHLGTGPNFTGGEFGPSLVHTRRGTYLYFSSTGTTGQHDIYRSRLGRNGRFGAPEAVTELNSPAVDQMPNLSRDGREIVFASSRDGNMDIYTSTMNRHGVWSTPVAVAAVNTADAESRPSLSGDGKRLYFGRGTTADVFVSTRTALGDDDD